MNERAEVVFLDRWYSDHVNAAAFPQKRSEGEALAAQCLEDAKRAGIDAAQLREAAGGDLVDYMIGAFEASADAEVDRLVAKDTS
jgi:hypothetical protein